MTNAPWRVLMRAALETDEQPQETWELDRLSRVWGARCVPLVYGPFLLLGELRGMRRLRGEVVGQARGRVLELGAGTGLNMKHYKSVEQVVLTEPDPGMVKRLERRLRDSSTSRTVVTAPAEQLPFEDGSFDTVVATMVFCTASDPQAALREIRRVLTPGGRLLFIEHVRANPGSRLETWQNHLYRPWRAFAYGCRCNQHTLENCSAPPACAQRRPPPLAGAACPRSCAQSSTDKRSRPDHDDAPARARHDLIAGAARAGRGPCSSPQARTLGIADGPVRPMLGALTESREAASTKGVTTASTPALRSRRKGAVSRPRSWPCSEALE
jgi:SAM-dependent methyltransferase